MKQKGLQKILCLGLAVFAVVLFLMPAPCAASGVAAAPELVENVKSADVEKSVDQNDAVAEEPANMYTLSFIPMGGSAVAPITAPAGTIISLTQTSERENWIFHGWCTDKAMEFPVASVELNCDMEVYAWWTQLGEPPLPTYTLTFVSQFGTAPAPITAPAGTTILLDQKPEWDGGTFRGWYSDQTLEEPVESVLLNEDTVVYALWAYMAPWPVLVRHKAFISGYPDGTIRPGGTLSRAEAAAIVCRILDMQPAQAAAQTYSDVAPQDWYYGDVMALSERSLLTGYPDGSFRPNSPVTRAEFTALIARANGMSGGTALQFPDLSGHWAAGFVDAMVSAGMLSGYPDGQFHPDRTITRAETIVALNRALGRTLRTADGLCDGMKTWSDNQNPDAWYYLDIQEATNSHNAFIREDANNDDSGAQGDEIWNTVTDDEAAP